MVESKYLDEMIRWAQVDCARVKLWRSWYEGVRERCRDRNHVPCFFFFFFFKVRTSSVTRRDMTEQHDRLDVGPGL